MYLPLYRFFSVLRNSGLPLGVDDYELLIHSMGSGWDFDKEEELLLLCKLIWMKDKTQEGDFERVFWSEWAGEKKRFAEIISQKGKAIKPTDEPSALNGDDVQMPKNIDEPQREAASEPSHQGSVSGQPHGQKIKVSIKEGAEGDDLGVRYDLEQLPQMWVVGNYLGIRARDMQQRWRRLRLRQMTGAGEEIDVAATVKELCKNDLLETPIMQLGQRNVSNVVLLIDKGGSMVGFNHLGNKLLLTLQRSLDTTGFFCRNLPNSFVFTDEYMTQPQPKQQLWSLLNKPRTSFIIYSDAGAARGSDDMHRFMATVDFLTEARRHCQHIVWLNPMPKSRWIGTTAELVAKEAPMFEATLDGMKGAVKRLLYK